MCFSLGKCLRCKLAPITVTRPRMFAVLRQTLVFWDLHSIPRLAAALAFYAVLSLAPFLVLAVGASAMLFGETITQRDTIQDLREIVGPEATLLIASLLSGGRHAPSNPLSRILTVLLLFFGASSAFVELRSALNYIWETPEPPSGLIGGFVKDRLFAFAMTAAMAFLLVACLSASVGIQVFQPFFARLLVLPGFAITICNFVFSFAVIGLTFSLTYRYVPARRIGWRDSWIAGLITAVVFTLGRVPLDLYLSHAVGSGYGAAASVVVFLMWIYIAAQIFYLGGEFARLYSNISLSNPLPIHSQR
jgi:membrane protein